MKVTIDTKEDSHEDIQKIMYILTSILEKKGNSLIDNNPSGNEKNDIANKTLVDTTNMMNLFDQESVKKEIQDTPPDFQSLMKLTREAKKEYQPRVELF